MAPSLSWQNGQKAFCDPQTPRPQGPQRPHALGWALSRRGALETGLAPRTPQGPGTTLRLRWACPWPASDSERPQRASKINVVEQHAGNPPESGLSQPSALRAAVCASSATFVPAATLQGHTLCSRGHHSGRPARTEPDCRTGLARPGWGLCARAEGKTQVPPPGDSRLAGSRDPRGGWGRGAGLAWGGASRGGASGGRGFGPGDPG